MRKLRLRSWSVAIALSMVAVLAGPAVVDAAETSVGTKIEDFTLPDFHGQEHSLSDLADAKAIVVAFVGNDCPLVRLYAPRLSALARKYESRGVRFLAVNSNRHDTVTEMADFARNYELPFPLLKDLRNEVADRFMAERTPEVFVLDEERVVRYRGRIDDQYAVGLQREDLSNDYLVRALDQVLGDRPVRMASTEAVGCVIARAPKVEPHGDVTYTNQIARIMNKHCVECHREGELAPFALTSYDDVAGWAETIREVIRDNRMPPWFADGRYGQFSNDCSMSAEEKQLIEQWAAAGTPEGDPAELPEPPEFVAGWRIGEPDLVLEMEEEFHVPAEGVVDYQHIRVDPGFDEDVWVTAAEARPGNPSVVHHIVLFAVPKGSRGRGDATSFGQMVAIYAPGMPPWQYPDGTAMLIKKGMELVFQLHYTPNGRAQSDRSYVGLKFTKAENVKQKIRYGMALNMAFEIPPGADDHEVQSQVKFRRDTLLLNLFPHMHYRGKSFRFDAYYPDGSHEVLLDVPNYDFNWQLRYDLAEPKLMPKGTRVICTGKFDNSADNPRNPNPNETVRFGLQSWEEMMVGYYTTVAYDQDLAGKDDDE